MSGTSQNSAGKNVPWVYIPGMGPVVLGLTGAISTSSIYYYNSSTFNQPVAGTAGSFVVGFATRYGTGGQNLGNDTWYYNSAASTPAVSIVPEISSTNYTASVTGGIYENSGTAVNPTFTSASGVITGVSTRVFGTASTAHGTDAWVFNAGAAILATNATQIGLLQDSGNTNAAYSLTTTLSASDTNTVQTNSIYTESTVGLIGGSTTVYSATAYNTSAGTMTWLYAPGTTPGTLNVSYASPSNNSFANSATPGVIGNSVVGTYTRVGLYSDSAHVNGNGLDTSSISAVNASGQAAGLSTVFLTNHTSSNASDAWAYSAGTGTTLINPITASTSFSLQYNNNTGGTNVTVHNSTITALNTNGWVAGFSQRYDYNYTGTNPTAIQGTNTSSIVNSPLGYDAWLYDAANQKTYVVDDSVSSSTGLDGYFYSVIQYLSDDGIALGYYANSPAQNPENIFAYFVDSSGVGHFDNLGSGLTLTNTLAAGGWSSLSSLISIDAAGDLYGLGVTSSGANAVFELQAAVPEPASIGILSVAAVTMLVRRRKA